MYAEYSRLRCRDLLLSLDRLVDRIYHAPIHFVRIRHKRRQPSRDALCRKKLAHLQEIIGRGRIYVNADGTMVVDIDKAWQTNGHSTQVSQKFKPVEPFSVKKKTPRGKTPSLSSS